MAEFELNAEPREGAGKSATRQLRRKGKIPAVLYGAGKDPASIVLDANSIRKQLENEAYFSHILDVRVNGESTQVVLKDLQRDPASDQIIHMDLLRVSATQEITMNVPLHFINEETSPGKKAGGVVSHLVVDVEISCLPQDLPEYLEVDMAAMEIGDALHLSDVKVPEGVTISALAHDASHDQPVVSIQHSQKFEEEEELAVEGEGLLAEGAEVPTVAEGAAPAAPKAEEDEDS